MWDRLASRDKSGPCHLEARVYLLLLLKPQNWVGTERLQDPHRNLLLAINGVSPILFDHPQTSDFESDQDLGKGPPRLRVM